MSQITFHSVTKSFPGVRALDGVSFGIEPGSCHALVGENGAGKSTLGKILAGVYTPDSGEIRLDGRSIQSATPLEARKFGIAMVHQELAFCPNLTVAENLCLGDMPRRRGWVDRRRMRDQASRMLSEIDAEIDLDAPISELSTGQEQLVQIAAALGTDAKVIIMDEPTSSLSLGESEHLFKLLEKLKEQRITVIYVSHRLDEIFRLCDRVTVLRDGRYVASENVAETTRERLIHQMIGRQIERHEPSHLTRPLGAELLRVEGLSSPGKFEDIRFSLHVGEVLGFAGLVGAGRSEIAQAIFGLDPEATGDVFIRGNKVPLGDAGSMLAHRVGLLPEDRKRLGLVLGMNCRENLSLAALPSVTRIGFVDRDKEHALVNQYADRLQVKAPSMEASVSGLSGGNQQKIALAKWLARQCEVLIVDEPTRGIDVGAKAEIHRLLDELACQGLGLILISSELPEVMNMSRRIMVIRDGEIAGVLDRAEFSQPRLMKLMAGLDSQGG